MKAKDITIGGEYVAKVSGRLVKVRVNATREQSTYRGRTSTVYDVTNLSTGRHLTFRSAAKFRRVALAGDAYVITYMPTSDDAEIKVRTRATSPEHALAKLAEKRGENLIIVSVECNGTPVDLSPLI